MQLLFIQCKSSAHAIISLKTQLITCKTVTYVKTIALATVCSFSSIDSIYAHVIYYAAAKIGIGVSSCSISSRHSSPHQ